ncbi:4'-phosphopantetheinyl transferase EntD [Streptomyces umbrinus]|uniref:4'-phosphopantetheinyl transferase family protein n=1 Tax=Streptomyces umbrinus TaxID=67370 RepID=UPI00167E270C|nr:4'-phosphopantetheinyl transferase superfamily protein [Streptomyces umbrinus]MCR3728381.1 4'-phosphopantetheinyl transferase EntD [Streptomyces umbrinus]GHH35310.1 4'-phosphopantetheinyl transferase [Streptomyces umbrinus]
MIEELLPESVVAVEAHGDERPGGTTPYPELYPEEQALISRAVEKRRREFTVVRGCARHAMEKLGVPPQAVLPGERGAPQWPAGLIGSMTHCEGYAAAALARATDLASIGIDAEPHLPLPDNVLASVALPDEDRRLRGLAERHPGVHWDRLLFSAKESVYKAWFPLTGKWLDFSEADIDVFMDPGHTTSGGLRTRLLVPGPVVDGRRIGHFDGRWTVRRGLVATAVTVPHARD